MENSNVFQILSYGVIGLGFLLALLAYRLLAREQQGTPREAIIKATYFFMGFSVLLCVIGFAAEVYGRHSPDTPGEPAADSSLESCEASLSGALETNTYLMEEKEGLLASTLQISDLALISDQHFEQDAAPKEVLGAINQLVKDAEVHSKNERHYAYRLFELETMIAQFGVNISTEIREVDMEAPYSKIQELLKGIGYYQGPIDGSQAATHEALVRFQENYNERAEREVFDPENDFGFFGYRTLEAVRSTYRKDRV